MEGCLQAIQLRGGSEAKVGFVTSTVSAGDGCSSEKLQATGLGLFIPNFYAGGFMHDDDIKSLATSVHGIVGGTSRWL